MGKDFKTVFSALKEDVSTYINLQLKLLKIETYEKIGYISATLSYIFLVLFIIFFAILFLFFGFGLYLGSILNNLALGISLIGVLYLIILALVIIYRKNFINKILGLFIRELTSTDIIDTNEENRSDDENHET